jgi:hypothetical protein
MRLMQPVWVYQKPFLLESMKSMEHIAKIFKNLFPEASAMFVLGANRGGCQGAV